MTDIVAALVAVAIAAVVVAGHCGLNFKIEFVNKFMCGILDGSQSRAVERLSGSAVSSAVSACLCGRLMASSMRATGDKPVSSLSPSLSPGEKLPKSEAKRCFTFAGFSLPLITRSSPRLLLLPVSFALSIALSV